MRFVTKCVLAVAVLVGCSQIVFAQSSKTSTTANCSHSSNGQKVIWTKVSNIKKLKLPATIGQKKLPTKYSVYTVNQAQLKKVMQAAKSANSTKQIVLPATDGNCIVFAIENSSTMSPELAAKFPELASLKGTAVTDKNVTARIDYDGSTLSAEVNQMSKIYFLAPWKKGKKTYYLVYNKEDAGIPKSRLESK